MQDFTIIGQLTYFYTDKVGLAAGAIATVLLISKIIDAFTDLIMGNIVDHTKTVRKNVELWAHGEQEPVMWQDLLWQF